MTTRSKQPHALTTFLQGETFVVLCHNAGDPSAAGPYEAWAYEGPLDFDRAGPVVFGAGQTPYAALAALAAQLAGRRGTAATEPVCPALLDDRQLATVLAALRFHQAENLQGTSAIPDEAIRAIATDCGRLTPLSFDEVEHLCAQLQCDDSSEAVKVGPSAVDALRRIHDVLYRDARTGRYAPDKSWDADTLEAVAAVVTEHIQRPGTSRKRGES